MPGILALRFVWEAAETSRPRRVHWPGNLDQRMSFKFNENKEKSNRTRC